MNLLEEKIEIENLYENFRKPLLRYISYKVSDSHSAEEILNDVFFKASKSLESLNEKTKIQSWLYKIASNQIIDYYRRKKEYIADLEDDISTHEVKQESIYNELNCCVDKFLDQLPKQYSNSLKDVYLEELTQKEYATLNNIKLSTVKSQVKRGKKSMKLFFEKCCSFERNRLDNITDYKLISSSKSKI